MVVVVVIIVVVIVVVVVVFSYLYKMEMRYFSPFLASGRDISWPIESNAGRRLPPRLSLAEPRSQTPRSSL